MDSSESHRPGSSCRDGGRDRATAVLRLGTRQLACQEHRAQGKVTLRRESMECIGYGIHSMWQEVGLVIGTLTVKRNPRKKKIHVTISSTPGQCMREDAAVVTKSAPRASLSERRKAERLQRVGAGTAVCRAIHAPRRHFITRFLIYFVIVVTKTAYIYPAHLIL